MNANSKRLLRYLDGEMPPDEAERFRASLARSPELRRELQEMQEIGACVRSWSAQAEARAAELLEPTLRRVRLAGRQRARRTTFGYACAAAFLVAQPWSHRAADVVPAQLQATPAKVEGAAIERVEATDQQARVFVLGGSNTPVVWLADEGADTAASQGPG